MVHGLNVFGSAFKDFSENYVVIGGTASQMILQLEGVEFRATKDIDIVVIVEALSPEFASAMWKFVEDGGYEVYETKDHKPKYYRFLKPKKPEYPVMLELLSRVPDGIDYSRPGVITPIPVDGAVESLSAILLNDEYYDLIRRSSVLVDGVPVVSKDALIQLKARAWMDLSDRREQGENVKGDDIKKHIKDVIRFFSTLTADDSCELDVELIKADMLIFVGRIVDIDPQQLKPESVVPELKGVTFADMAVRLKEYFAI